MDCPSGREGKCSPVGQLCLVCGSKMRELVKHVGSCRAGSGCRCPERDYECIECLEAHPPAVRTSGKGVVAVESFRARRASGWRPPRERYALADKAPEESSPLRERLLHARRLRGWSQALVSRKVRKSQSLVSRWENGKSTPDRATAALLWQVLAAPAEGGS